MNSFRLTDSSAVYKPQLEQMAGLGLFCFDEGGIPLHISKGDAFSVSLEDGSAEVIYKQTADIFCGAFTLARGGLEGKKTFADRFDLCGAMIDNSRNSVTRIEKMKEYIVYSVSFGLNAVYLYNEDTFDIEGEPYFGYMRGSYSKADIKELCDFSAAFGVELIPCIQTLAHLNQALRWACYGGTIRDMGDTLLADDDRTYALIEKMVKTWREVCTTDRINIGMDEAHYLGRGKHLDLHGAEPKFDIMCRHLKKVIDICAKYGFKPMMWSDMFFRIAFGGYYSDEGIDKSLLAKVPKDVTLVYWDYYSTEQEKYAKQIAKHALFDNELAFAGGAWKWSGYTPSIDHSWRVSQMALEEIKKKGVRQALVTCWGDDGAECLSACVLPVLALYGANRLADGEEAEWFAKEAVKAACGYSVEEFFALCRPSVTPCENRTPYANPTKYLLYNDVLKGLFDKHTTSAFPEFYKECAEELGTLAERGNILSYLFDVQSKLCSLLELKSTVGVELKAAYDGKDRVALERIAKDVLPEILRRTDVFYEALRAAWLSESRATGFDTIDIRIGGMTRRVLSAMRTVYDYLDGKIDRIEELEAERLFFDCRSADSDKCLTVGMNSYIMTATSNIL